MRSVFLAVVVALALTGAASAQDEPLPPCGPAGDLSDELKKNVAEDSRCFEIRMYTARPAVTEDGETTGGINELHDRFRNGEVSIFEKHGAKVVAVWQSLDAPNTLIWMLAYRDRAHRTEVWNGFREDPDWEPLLAKYPAPLEGAEVIMMSASDYSSLK